jgi:hypothetical protein
MLAFLFSHIYPGKWVDFSLGSDPGCVFCFINQKNGIDHGLMPELPIE